MNTQPKPTGEWTVEHLANAFELPKWFRSVADAHNAALADAQRQIDMDTECIERIRNHGMKLEVERDQLREQLAAEAEVFGERIFQLGQQLAAEREKLGRIKLDWPTTYENFERIVADLNKQLAAEHENLMKLERDWHKVINEVLKCNPIPAKDRTDGQLEPPWEVIARLRKHPLSVDQLREQLAAEREKVQTLTDALESIATDDQTLWGTIARQTLAKVNQ